jgi:hypothetical protein
VGQPIVAAAAFRGGFPARDGILCFTTTRPNSVVGLGAASKGCSHDWLPHGPHSIPTPNPDTPECYTHNFVTAFRLYILLLICILIGCVNIPDSYAPPVQRKPLGGTEPNPVGHFVQMGDLNATAYIVKDVADGAEAGSWRWARKRPELRFFLDTVDNLSFKVDFSIAESLLRETGPVTISVFINGHPLDVLKYSEAGEKHFDKPVPVNFLRAKSMNIAAMEIDKVWVSKSDGAVLGFILTRAGFTQ